MKQFIFRKKVPYFCQLKPNKQNTWLDLKLFYNNLPFQYKYFVLYICVHIILGQLWNLVVLELTETETNYEAGFRELDKMEQTKIPVKVVSVLRRNMTTAEHKKVSGIKI